MSGDEFLVMRGLLALAHVDGQLTPDEASWVKERLASMDIGQEQATTLREDIRSPQPPLLIYGQLSSNKAKGWFLTLARILFHADGEFCASEQEMMAKLENAHEQTLETTLPMLKQDLGLVRERVEQDVEEIREHATKHLGPISSLMAWVVGKFEG
ncbi:MAG: hypothetical protein VX834_05045 [Myxococcota bacterium]|nr:hypothetical protein [Myxococcota bacterium]